MSLQKESIKIWKMSENNNENLGFFIRKFSVLNKSKLQFAEIYFMGRL